MNEITFWTPSYRNDADRFALLRKSIREFYSDSAKHIVVVPREDISIFKKILKDDSNVELLIQNDFVNPIYYPSKLYKLIEKFFPNQTWRFKSISGRIGWIIHIIVKFSLPEMVSNGTVVLLDSDVFFTRRFSNKDLDIVSDDKILIKNHPKTESGTHRRHMERSRKTLAVNPGSTDFHYMSTPDIWYPEYVKELQNHLEMLYEKPWQEALFEIGDISSSTLYGVFVEEVLKPELLRVRSPLPYFIAWDQNSYDEFLRHPKECCDDKLTAVIQSNINCSVNNYIKVVEQNFFNQKT